MRDQSPGARFARAPPPPACCPHLPRTTSRDSPTIILWGLATHTRQRGSSAPAGKSNTRADLACAPRPGPCRALAGRTRRSARPDGGRPGGQRWHAPASPNLAPEGLGPPCARVGQGAPGARAPARKLTRWPALACASKPKPGAQGLGPALCEGLAGRTRGLRASQELDQVAGVGVRQCRQEHQQLRYQQRALRGRQAPGRGRQEGRQRGRHCVRSSSQQHAQHLANKHGCKEHCDAFHPFGVGWQSGTVPVGSEHVWS